MKVEATKMKPKNNPELKPRLRFPKFWDAPEWERKQLCELLFETKQRNKELEYGPQDVLSVSGEYGCVNQIEYLGRSYAGASVKNYHIVETGDIVYTKSPLKKNPYGIIKENKGKPGIVSTLYAVYRTTELGDPTYLDHYFSRDYHLNSYLQPIVNKGAKNDMKVNNSAVLGGEILIPKIDEQQKIAYCLSSLDDLIATHTHKLDALQTHKKGLLQQLFPVEGETLPQLRFPEFRDAPNWDEQTIDHISRKVIAGGTPSTLKKEYWDGNIRWMNSGELNLKKVYEVQGRITDEGLQNSSTKLIPKRCVLIGLAGQGKTRGTVAMNMVELCTNQSIAAIHPNKKIIDSNFLYHNLDGRYDELRRISSGSGGRGGLNLNIIKSLNIYIPSIPEQQKIADCLSSLDELIAAQTQKLDALIAHKKGLMQQLFPSPDEAHR